MKELIEMRQPGMKALLLSCVLLGACRSDPVQYHTLVQLKVAPARSADADSTLQVERVTVPPQVDRSQMVLRQGANGLQLLDTHWWGASLVDEVQSAVTEQLSDQPSGPEKGSLRLDIQRFDLVPGSYALIDAKWRLRSALAANNTSREITCQTTLQAAAGASVDELVKAQQANLMALTTLINQTWRSGTRQCPSR